MALRALRRMIYTLLRHYGYAQALPDNEERHAARHAFRETANRFIAS